MTTDTVQLLKEINTGMAFLTKELRAVLPAELLQDRQSAARWLSERCGIPQESADMVLEQQLFRLHSPVETDA